MPRSSRVTSNSGIYHIMMRGINRQTIFESNEDKGRFLYTLNLFKRPNNYNVYGYCIMDNHVHVILGELEDSISIAIKRISASYVFWYNNKYERCGHLFQDRFRSEAIEDDRYLLTALRYIHLNPVKAGMVNSYKDYEWSSFKEFTSLQNIVDSEYVLDMFSDNSKEAIKLFEKFMDEENDDKCIDFNDNIRMHDSELLDYLHNFGIKNVSELQQLSKEKRNIIINELKKINGISLRQLARVTGLSKKIIERA